MAPPNMTVGTPLGTVVAEATAAPLHADHRKGLDDHDLVEVRILWGQDLLELRHLRPPYSFVVGESQAGTTRCDFEVAGLTDGRQSLVERHDDAPWVALLPETRTTVDLVGHDLVDLEKARTLGLVVAQDDLTSAQRIALQPDLTIRAELGPITFLFRRVECSRKLPLAMLQGPRRKAIATWLAVSVAAHLGWLFALSSWMPPLGSTAEDTISAEQRIVMMHHLQGAAEREVEPVLVTSSEAEVILVEGGTGSRSKGEEGAMGSTASFRTGHHYAVEGPEDQPDPHLARHAALRDAATFGMVGLLNTGAGGDIETPTPWFGGHHALGRDPLSARGNMWGDEIGDTYGSGGLGLSGVGEGGGGRGEGIGLGSIGTVGQGSGRGTGQGFGNGHDARPPRVRVGATSVSGRLPPECVQRIIRQSFGHFRLCYEQGLRRNHALAGRVKVRFVIGRDGSVSNASGGGDLPDSDVVACVARAFYGLSFPQPEGGIVMVGYPIVFTPTR